MNWTEPNIANHYNESLNNCSFDYPYPAVQVAFRLYASTPILLLGVVGNVVNTLVYSMRRLRVVPLNRCLLVLSLSDLLLILTSLIMFAAPVLAEKLGIMDFIMLIERVIRWSFAFSQMAATWGVYLTILISVYQCIILKHRYFARKYLTSTVMNRCIWGILLFGMAFNLNRFLELDLSECHSFHFNRSGMQLMPGGIMRNHTYYMVYHIYLTAIILVTIPIATLIPFNIYFCKYLYDSQKVRRPLMLIAEMTVQLTARSEQVDSALMKAQRPSLDDSHHQSEDTPVKQNESNRLKHLNKRSSKPRKPHPHLNGMTNQNGSLHKQNGTTSASIEMPKHKQSTQKESDKESDIKITLMVVGVSLEFLICNILTFTNNIIEIMAHHNDNVQQFMFSQKYTIMVEIGNLLVTLNAATTCFIYIACNPKFRRALVKRIQSIRSSPRRAIEGLQSFRRRREERDIVIEQSCQV